MRELIAHGLEVCIPANLHSAKLYLIEAFDWSLQLVVCLRMGDGTCSIDDLTVPLVTAALKYVKREFMSLVFKIVAVVGFGVMVMTLQNACSRILGMGTSRQHWPCGHAFQSLHSHPQCDYTPFSVYPNFLMLEMLPQPLSL